MKADSRRKMVECVPNFSEERDPAKIKVITDAIRAVAGALGAALASMVANLTQGKTKSSAARDAAMQDGLKVAVAVPWETAVACLDVIKVADRAMRHGHPNSMTDALVGLQMAFAGVRGGLWNVTINQDIKDARFNADMNAKCAALLAEAQAFLDGSTAEGDARLRAMQEEKK